VALAPADFYAYSRATGQPYPESPEERAAQAPQVLEFRRNQLKSADSGSSNPVALGFGIALGLAGLGGAGLAARRMLRSGKATGQSGVSQTDLSKYDTPQMREVAKTKPTFVEPSKVATATPSTPARQTIDINTAVDDEVTRLLNDVDFLKRVEAEEAAEILKQPEMRAEQSRQQAQVRRALSAKADDVLLEIRSESPNTLVTQQQETGGFNVRQAIAALESGEDQQTGRMKNQLQRNEDLDLGQIEVLEDITGQQRNWMMEQDEPINRVASQLSDGLPIDQAEDAGVAAQKFVSSALAKQRPSREPLLDIETKMYDLVATAAESGLKLEPKRALSILTNPGIELTTDEINLFNVNPEIGKFALKGQTFDPGQSQTGGAMSITGERLKSIPNVGLDPQSSITSAASGTSIRGRSRVQNEPDVFRQRVDSYGRPITEDVVNIDPGGTVTVSPGRELTELDIPEEITSSYTRFTQDPVTGKTQQEYAPKGMRAISTKEGKTYYVPMQDPGGVGVYGEERSYASGPLIKYDMPEQERIAGAYSKTASRKPTDMPFVEKAQGGSGFSDMDSNQLQSFVSNAPEGRVRQAGIQELNRRQTSQRSLEVSEAVRRANIEGRDPQMILKQFGIGL
jgi:hypothetical protein